MYITEKAKDAVWNKAQLLPRKDPHLYRKDRFGYPIFKPSYGKTSAMGWELDHILPVSLGGSNKLTNLQPLNWLSNRLKSNKI